MTSGQPPERRNDPDAARPDDAKRKLAITLAVLALVLTVLLIVIFGWWQREGEETDEDPVSLWTLVYDSGASGEYARTA